MRPRLRRIRRWSFIVTLPGGVLLARTLDIGLSAAEGLGLGVAAAVLDLLLLVSVALLGTRVLGSERREVVLDLLMHPAARRAIRAEARMLATLPLALLRRVTRRRRAGAEFPYHGRSMALGFAVALVPAVIAEGVALHLLLPPAWEGPRLALAAVQAYGLLMLASWGLGPRAHPHRLDDGVLEVRSGQLYRARIPLERVARAERRCERVEGGAGLVVRGEEALLPSDGRVDVTIRLAGPVEVERPLGDPISVTSIAAAVDDPDTLLRELEDRRRTSASSPRAAPSAGRRLGWLAPADLVEAVAS